MRLILFSGGVESTALLTQASSSDILLVIKPIFITDCKTYNDKNIEKIAKFFDMKISYANCTLPEIGKVQFVHQMKIFIALSSMLVSRNTEITEVWCGRNSSEPGKNIVDMINKYMAIWDTLHPNIPFNHPLTNLSKKQQWDMIPSEIKGSVSSCIYHRFCGQCYKCKEWLCLSENLPKNM